MKLAKFSKDVKKKKTVGKGEIARYEQFLLFPQCFKNADTEKTRACLGKGQTDKTCFCDICRRKE